MWTSLIKTGICVLATKQIADTVKDRQQQDERARRRYRNRNLVLGTAFGAAAGAAAGLLLAPRPGRESRKRWRSSVVASLNAAKQSVCKKGEDTAAA
ncbi:MAG: YtxH domain-containing protein [Desulfosalsimonadaceae bacterium]